MLGDLLLMSGGWSLTGVTVMLNISVTSRPSLTSWRDVRSSDESDKDEGELRGDKEEVEAAADKVEEEAEE